MLARATYGYVLAAERSGSPARALFPDDRADRPDDVDALEAFSRLALAWGAWLHNPLNPSSLTFELREINLGALMRDALIQGTDRANPYTYWGDIGDMDQRIVETSNLSLALWLSRERVFNELSETERAQVIDWLAQVDGKETYPDNWILFPAFSQFVRLQLGYAAPEDDLNARLEQMCAFYRGDGWYADGGSDKFDLYNAWMFGTHYLLWAWMDGERRPDLRHEVLTRAQTFLACFPYFFGANGSYVAWGRSLAGRFAAVATFAIGHALKIAPANAGLVRRISSGCLRYFYDHGTFDADTHYAYQGFHGNFPPAGESYVSSGSPYSAFHGLLALMFDRDDPFWTATEAPLPVEVADFERAFLVPGFTLSGQKATGQVLLLNSRSSHESDTIRNDYVPKYGKFTYSTHAPFNVVPVNGSYAPDAMIALTHDGITFGHREGTRAGSTAPGMIWCEFDEIVSAQPQTLCVAVLLWKDLQVRLARIQPTLAVRAFEAPGALGADGAAYLVRRSDIAAGWEYAAGENRAVGIRRVFGYDAQRASHPFLGYSNINLASPYVEQPLVYESQASDGVRMLGAVSLLRPAPFDPEQELLSISVSPHADGTVHVELADGTNAFVALGDMLPQAIRLGEFDIEGNGLRYIRINADASEICGIGLTEIRDVARFMSPGTVSLRKGTDGKTYVSSDVGLVLEPGWLGMTIQTMQVRDANGEWVEFNSDTEKNTIPAECVAEWSVRSGLRLVEFRLGAL